MSDTAALYAAILAEPGEDTPRLAYADALADLPPVRKTCPTCNGRGEIRGDGMFQSGRPCLACGGVALTPHSHRKGTSTVIDTANADRAEFIRIQHQLASWDCTFKQTKEQPGWKHNCGTDENAYWLCQPLRSRESALLAVHESDWRRGGEKCNCKGDGPTCWDGDAGGLLRKFNYAEVVSVGGHPVNQTIIGSPVRVTRWRLGFPDRVEVPRLGDCVVVKQSNIGGHPEPSPWLAAVVRHHPIAEVVPLDREPDGFGTSWHWEARDLPPRIYDMMVQLHPRQHNDDRHGRWCGSFLTRQSAISALARTLVAFARKHAN